MKSWLHESQWKFCIHFNGARISLNMSKPCCFINTLLLPLQQKNGSAKFASPCRLSVILQSFEGAYSGKVQKKDAWKKDLHVYSNVRKRLLCLLQSHLFLVILSSSHVHAWLELRPWSSSIAVRAFKATQRSCAELMHSAELMCIGM